MSGEFDELDLGQTIRGFSAGQKLFGRYTLIRILGRGGMGVVWLARDEQLERDVALKFLPEMLLLDKAVINSLKKETRRSLELTHQHIVRIYDFVQDSQSACISMEYVDGETLSALRVEKPNEVFECKELEKYVQELAEALDYAHNKAHIVHRDLKPANLMVNSKGDLKITDFGIARSLSESVSMMSMRHSSGTLVYMSPQQLDGEKPSHLDDIYSLGATLYELLTSKPPFYSGGIERQIHEKTAPSITKRREDLEIANTDSVLPHWEQTIAACLSKDPAQRPQNAAEVANRLCDPNFRPAQLVRPAEGVTPVKRNILPLVVAAGLLIVMGGAAAAWYFGAYLPAQRRAAVEQAQRTAETRKAQEAQAAQAAETARVAEEKRKAEEAAGALEAENKRKAEETQKQKEAAQSSIATAAKEHPYENSLGMKFVPVPGTEVLFSIWDTRVQDYQAFVNATQHEWPKPDFEQGPTHPAVNVSWEDAKAFCAWLTKKEGEEGKLVSNQQYRLPTDAEWSVAVGLPQESGRTPKEKGMKIENVYPWGNQWPPPKGAGNYHSSLNVDEYPYTSRVGSFEPNEFGLFDMCGNVLQWCEDRYDDTNAWRVLRGASWSSVNRVSLLSSSRSSAAPADRDSYLGFRCVLAGGSSERGESSGSTTRSPSSTAEPQWATVAQGQAASSGVASSTQPSATSTPKPRLVYAPAPSFPPEASGPKNSGTGRFRLTFDAKGNVTNVEVVQSTGNQLFDQSAIKTLRQWKCSPGQGWVVTVPVTFRTR